MTKTQPCGIPTVRGGVCEQASTDPFPCCRNHLGHWSVDSSERLLRVARHYAGQVAAVWTRCGATCGRPEVRDWPEVQVFFGASVGRGVAVRMALDDAAVVADALAELGDQASAESILLAINEARLEWPDRQRHLANCGVFGCGQREVSLRSGRCAEHTLS